MADNESNESNDGEREIEMRIVDPAELARNGVPENGVLVCACEEPTCPFNKVRDMKTRVMRDEANEIYVNLNDIVLAATLVGECEHLAGHAQGNPMACLFAHATQQAIERLLGVLAYEDDHIAPSTVADVPDTIPTEWTTE